MPLLDISYGDFTCLLAPALGGAIDRLDWRGHALMRPAPAGAADVLQTACFPMVPYVNRVKDGRFSFQGGAVALSPNLPGHPHALHGQGWRAVWEVARAGPGEALLRFAGGGDDWPWPYLAEQHFRLNEVLEVELAVTNLGDGPMPASLGLHPFFPDARVARLHAPATGVYFTDDMAFPTGHGPIPPGWGFDPPRPLHGPPLDHCLSGFTGEARLIWPDRALTIVAPACRYLQVYAPPDQDFACVEAQTAPPAALNSGQDVTAIPPGGRFALITRFEPGAGPPK